MNNSSLKRTAHKLLTQYGSQQSRRSITPEQLDAQAERVALLAVGLGHHGMMLLDDPVGTGKTPVALCVAKILIDTGKLDHALVIAPSEKVANLWHERSKQIGLVSELEQRTNGTKRKKRGPLVVCTHRTAPSQLYQDQIASQTLVIVDEAHRGFSNEETVAFQAIRPLVQGTRLLLVTATPLQISPHGFLTMLTIGFDSKEKDNLYPPVKRYAQAVKNLLSRWEQEQETEKEKKAEQEVCALQSEFELALEPYRLPPHPHYDQDNIPDLEPDLVKLTNSSSWLRAYYVAQLIPELIDKGKGDMFNRRLVSCAESFWEGSAGKELLSEAENHEELQLLVRRLRDRLGAGVEHPKLAATCTWIIARAARRKTPRHILVFCVFKETQKVLGEVLTQQLAPDTVCCATDYVPKRWLERFRQPPSASNPPMVLIVRDNLSESIDLDGGAPCVVHYDLPWNPARIQQRYGRAVRISSGFLRVHPKDVFVPVLDTEVDRRMFDTLVRRVKLVRRLLPDRHGLRSHPESLLGAGSSE